MRGTSGISSREGGRINPGEGGGAFVKGGEDFRGVEEKNNQGSSYSGGGKDRDTGETGFG